jgi:hypothetical protein
MIQSQIKCRFCGYMVAPFYTGKDGKRHSGFARLQGHIESEHPDQAEDISDRSHTERSDEAEEHGCPRTE